MHPVYIRPSYPFIVHMRTKVCLTREPPILTGFVYVSNMNLFINVKTRVYNTSVMDSLTHRKHLYINSVFFPVFLFNIVYEEQRLQLEPLQKY